MQILLDSFNKRPLDHNAHLRIIPWQYLSLNKAMIICIRTRWLNGVIIFPLHEGLAFHLIQRKTLFTKGRFLLSLVEFDPVILEMNMS